MTFKGFNDSKRLLDRSQYFDMLDGKKTTAMLPRSWKKSFDNGVIIPTKMRQCNVCKDGILCTTCNNQINENKKFEANLNLLKTPNDFGYMLPYYILQKTFDLSWTILIMSNYHNFIEKIFYLNKFLFNKWMV